MTSNYEEGITADDLKQPRIKDAFEKTFPRVKALLEARSWSPLSPERHPDLIRAAIARAAALRGTHITDPDHDYIVALADELELLLHNIGQKL